MSCKSSYTQINICLNNQKNIHVNYQLLVYWLTCGKLSFLLAGLTGPRVATLRGWQQNRNRASPPLALKKTHIVLFLKMYLITRHWS